MNPNMLDVGSKSDYPAGDLSNFSAFNFCIDEIECCSMEGFLQSLKFDKSHIQVEVCKLSGIKAKHRGKDRNNAWKLKRGLWWKGEFIQRTSQEYQRLLDRAYIELAKNNENFRQALIDTKDLILTHHIGKNEILETVLTQKEFCARLMKLRKLINNKTDLSNISRL